MATTNTTPMNNYESSDDDLYDNIFMSACGSDSEDDHPMETIQRPSLPKTLKDIRFFLYAYNTRDDARCMVYAVAIGNEYPLCLKRHKICVDAEFPLMDDELGMILDTQTEKFPITPLSCKGVKVQESVHPVSSKADMEAIVKKTKTTFGVFGKEQKDYFSAFLEQVTDIAPLIMQEVKKMKNDNNGDRVIGKKKEKPFCGPMYSSSVVWMDGPPESLAEYMLRTIPGYLKHHSMFHPEKNLKDFTSKGLEDWIYDKVFKNLFR